MIAENETRSAFNDWMSTRQPLPEGCGKFNKDAARFYAIVRGSALECAAILDAFEAIDVLEPAALKDARGLLERVVSMLTGLIRP